MVRENDIISCQGKFNGNLYGVKAPPALPGLLKMLAANPSFPDKPKPWAFICRGYDIYLIPFTLEISAQSQEIRLEPSWMHRAGNHCNAHHGIIFEHGPTLQSEGVSSLDTS